MGTLSSSLPSLLATGLLYGSYDMCSMSGPACCPAAVWPSWQSVLTPCLLPLLQGKHIPHPLAGSRCLGPTPAAAAPEQLRHRECARHHAALQAGHSYAVPSLPHAALGSKARCPAGRPELCTSQPAMPHTLHCLLQHFPLRCPSAAPRFPALLRGLLSWVALSAGPCHPAGCLSSAPSCRQWRGAARFGALGGMTPWMSRHPRWARIILVSVLLCTLPFRRLATASLFCAGSATQWGEQGGRCAKGLIEPCPHSYT